MTEFPLTSTLAWIAALTLAISALFVGTGLWLARWAAAGRTHVAPLSLEGGRAYFVGLCAFLAFFVPASRVAGARIALIAALVLMAGATVAQVRRGAASARATAAMAGAIALMASAFAFTNALLWSNGIAPGAEPSAMAHLGSIHSGRYANYGWFIAEFDRVPWLAQNGAQSILTGVDLLLGSGAPLVALMSWLPVTAAFLCLLLFGIYREYGYPARVCAVAVYLTMFCNVALSLVAIMVFDNGSPFAFVGYTDLLAAVATFLIVALWLRDRVAAAADGGGRAWIIPALLAATWAWYAPQNTIVALGGLVPALVCFGICRRSRQARRLGAGFGAVVALSTAVAALQFGPFLPRAMQEDTGLAVQEADSGGLALRPYGQWVRSAWTGAEWNHENAYGTLVPSVYEKLVEQARRTGPIQVVKDVAWFVESQLWESLRIYGFAVLGLAGCALMPRRAGGHGLSPPAGALWLAMSASAFLCGFALYFTFELMHMKWWLTRFLVPGVALALTCLSLAALDHSRASTSRAAMVAFWAVLVGAATIGPVLELAQLSVRRLSHGVEATFVQPLRSMVGARAPFLFESLVPHEPFARRLLPYRYLIDGGPAAVPAVETLAMPMRMGRHAVSMRIEPVRNPKGNGAKLFALQVTADGKVVARREFAESSLAARFGALWADMEFDLSRDVRRGQLAVLLESDGSFVVSDVSVRRAVPVP